MVDSVTCAHDPFDGEPKSIGEKYHEDHPFSVTVDRGKIARTFRLNLEEVRGVCIDLTDLLEGAAPSGSGDDEGPKNLVGLWTPGAEILCGPCHGPLDSSRRPMANLEKFTTPRSIDPEADEKLGSCDHCNAEIILDAALANEQAMVETLREAIIRDGLKVNSVRLEQTGGMCSAVSVHFPDGGHILLTHYEGQSDEKSLAWTVGVYDPEGESCEDGLTDPFTAPQAVGIVLHQCRMHAGSKKAAESTPSGSATDTEEQAASPDK